MFFTPEEQKILAELMNRGGAPVEEVDDEAAALAEKLAAYRGVWVFVEQTEGEPAKVSWELLGKGRELADALGVELCAVVIGENVEHLCQRGLRLRRRQGLSASTPRSSATTGPKPT